jgi:hypothetical protein
MRKKEFSDKHLLKFIGTSKKINTVTDFIFDQVKRDKETQGLDVLSICSILLSFIVNSQYHLYFVMENIEKAISVLNKNYDIEEIFYRVQSCSKYRNCCGHSSRS